MMRIRHNTCAASSLVVVARMAVVLVVVVCLQHLNVASAAPAQQVHCRVLPVGVGAVAGVACLANLETFAAVGDGVDVARDGLLERCHVGVIAPVHKEVVEHIVVADSNRLFADYAFEQGVCRRRYDAFAYDIHTENFSANISKITKTINLCNIL